MTVRFRTLLLAALIGLFSLSVAQAKKHPAQYHAKNTHYKKPKKNKRGKFKTPKQKKMKKSKWGVKR
jgi:hypothetical protein